MIGGLLKLVFMLGTKSVRVWEWDNAGVSKPRLPNNPDWGCLANERPRLHFSGWELAHAIAKADFLNNTNPLLPGLAFLMQSCVILDVHSSNLRVVDDISDVLNDFAFTSFNGRIAQGIAMLFANQRGYVFTGHLSSDPAVPKGVQAADFIFENAAKDRMILESKGSFSQETNNPTKVKTVLKAALKDQVEPWLAKISPPAAKGFVTYTCIRERSQMEDSALIFVDPSGLPGDEPLELDPTWVRRRNYAGWLHVMGFSSAGSRLRQDERDVEDYILPVFRVGQYKVALAAAWDPHEAWHGFGIETSTLRRLENLARGDVSQVLEFTGLFEGLIDDRSRVERELLGSLMPDGTYFGRVDDADFLGFETFQL
ncbi:hypothetical protein ATY76_14325 [Rhizobium sp. R339]|uniref:hypothetical protein n=1 Tax=Rhizobium sp. R339 TaxID=1764273 RepID=UPI000B533B65|nr:hypothetical protein [Rhizobium sp. R339]OWV68079.1 hypothetical protein ATY76_14325 [Rhizobium sp. R339]